MDLLRIQGLQTKCIAAALISLARKERVEPEEIERSVVASSAPDGKLPPQFAEAYLLIIKNACSMFKGSDVIALADSSRQVVGFDSPDFEATVLKRKLDEDIVRLLEIVNIASKFTAPIKHEDSESPFHDMLVAYAGLSVGTLLSRKNLEWTEANFESEIAGFSINDLNYIMQLALISLLKRSERNKYSRDELAVALNLIDIPQVNETNEESVKSQIFNKAKILALD